MRKKKKLISVFLTVVMVFSMLTVAPFKVSAASCVKTQSEALSWLNSQEGARYDLDGAYGSQCSDFSSAYINYILYGNPRAGKFGVHNGRDYSNKNLYPSDWQVIKNTASFVPQPGDIFVTKGTTSFGHTGVVISSTVNNAKIADQNGMGDWSLDYGSPAHIHNITWTSSGTWCATYYIRPNFASNDHTNDGHGTIAKPGTQTISDGDYHVVSALDESYGLNIAYDSKDNGANVQLWNNMNDSNTTSLVSVKYLGTGYYTFTFKNSGKLLDVCNGGTKSGTNVWQCNANSSDAQQWVVKPSGDGYFYIISKCNNLCLDVTNGIVGGATNIQVCNSNNSKAQKWKFVASGYSTGRTLSDGNYHIVSPIDESYGLNIAYNSQETGANVQLWNNMQEDNLTSLVNVKYKGDGYYALTFLNSGKSLDVTDGKTLAGTNAQQCNINNSDAQRWIIKDVGYGCYNIIAKNSGLYLDICSGRMEKANNIQLYIGNGDNAQKWKFLSSGSSIGKTIDNGDYHIVSAIDSSFGLNVAYNSLEDGANVQLWNNMGNENETSVVSVEYIGNGLYSLIFKNSGKAFDVENAGKSDNVLQWSKNGNDCQKWIIKPNGKGDYNIITKCGGRYLNVYGGTATLAANINVAISSDLDSQSWKFVPKLNIGDINGDGLVSVADATELQKYVTKFINFKSEQLSIADTNGDKRVDISDVTQIQKYVAGMLSSLG